MNSEEHERPGGGEKLAFWADKELSDSINEVVAQFDADRRYRDFKFTKSRIIKMLIRQGIREWTNGTGRGSEWK